MKQAYLECGRIVTTHGVRGAVKIESWCDTPRVLASLSTVYIKGSDGSFLSKNLKNPSVSGDRIIAYVGDAASMDDALLLRGKTLYAAREDVPLSEGRVFLADLVGLPVIDAESGRVYGSLREIQPSPAADLYCVVCPDGHEVLLPDVPEFIKERDPERGIFVRVIPGFFDDED